VRLDRTYALVCGTKLSAIEVVIGRYGCIWITQRRKFMEKNQSWKMKRKWL